MKGAQTNGRTVIKSIIGQSVLGAALESFSVGRGAEVLVLGGFHGDEPKSVRLVRDWASRAAECPDVHWTFVPLVNPDGFTARKRRNANGVDLNRNFPTHTWGLDGAPARSRMYGGIAPGSEPESRAVIGLVERLRPACILSVHSISEGRYCNNYDGPPSARKLAIILRRCNGYPVRKSIGYPTPGSFGTWAGIELGIPTITLELPAERSLKQCLQDNQSILTAVARWIGG